MGEGPETSLYTHSVLVPLFSLRGGEVGAKELSEA